MKTVEITNKSSLQNVLTETTGEDVLVMRDGHAVALVTPFDDDDVEWYVREREPEFIASIERARTGCSRRNVLFRRS